MNRARRPPLQYPLALLFDRAVDSFSVSLSPDTTRHYCGTARNFLNYLGTDHPEVQRLNQLRREPQILGSQKAVLATRILYPSAYRSAPRLERIGVDRTAS